MGCQIFLGVRGIQVLRGATASLVSALHCIHARCLHSCIPALIPAATALAVVAGLCCMLGVAQAVSVSVLSTRLAVFNAPSSGWAVYSAFAVFDACSSVLALSQVWLEGGILA